ncbi:AI-2E family transporter [Iamia sp. SCSIO 61187]|uniref:AI-2E family transporter n=1 Tax=Iamia sp. SCSIO 61187 TaxID=2722752 RepID=UPI001C625A19|nr:AI-2E family transporter [Iamia sp. SCSIO 61187]QYG94085.1 AI-2E family transporter [Iamia sp. SCSIO 61187]
MDRRVRLTVGPAAIAVVFGAIVFAMVADSVLIKGRRPLGWALAAVVAAAAVEPLIGRASKYMRRGLALVVVLVPVLAFVGLVTWGVVGDLDAQVRRLQRDIPEVAADIEAGEQMGGAAREFELTEKAEQFAESLRRPSSRVGQEAAGGASTWALTLILTIFALGWGPRFADAALKQVPEGRRRDRAARVVGRAFLQSQTYIEVAVLMAVVTGFLAFGVFRLIDLPAPTPLALVVGVGTLVPSIGVVVATVPAALLAGGLVSPSTGIALVLGAIAAQIVHAIVLRRATRGAAHPGAALIVISFVVGYELYGVGGSVVGSCVTVFVAALLDSLAQEEREDVPIPASMTTLEETT